MYYWVKSSPVGGVRHPNRPVDPPASQPHTLNDVPGGGPNVAVEPSLRWCFGEPVSEARVVTGEVKAAGITSSSVAGWVGGVERLEPFVPLVTTLDAGGRTGRRLGDGRSCGGAPNRETIATYTASCHDES